MAFQSSIEINFSEQAPLPALDYEVVVIDPADTQAIATCIGNKGPIPPGEYTIGVTYNNKLLDKPRLKVSSTNQVGGNIDGKVYEDNRVSFTQVFSSSRALSAPIQLRLTPSAFSGRTKKS